MSVENFMRPQANGSAQYQPSLTATLTLAAWLARDISEPDYLLGELLSTTSRMLLVGPTGLGKTMFGLAVGFGSASGKGFLHWTAKRRASVLSVDGEMGRRQMKRRLQDAVRRAGTKPDSLIILSKEDFEDMPPLNSPGGQKWFDAFMAQHGPFDFVIFDNIQALLVGDMNDEEQWSKLLPWVRSLTRRSIGQLWFHHTGHDETKSYGSKAREWQMDTVAIMERVESEHDIAFALKFTKARERTPENRADFEPVTMTLCGDEWQRGEATSAKKASPTGKNKVALDALEKAISVAGAVPPTCADIPDDTPTVSFELWQRYAFQMGISDAEATKAKNQTFKRAVEALQGRNIIGRWNDQMLACLTASGRRAAGRRPLRGLAASLPETASRQQGHSGQQAAFAAFETVTIERRKQPHKRKKLRADQRPELPRNASVYLTCHRQGEVRTSWLSKRKAPTEARAVSSVGSRLNGAPAANERRMALAWLTLR